MNPDDLVNAYIQAPDAQQHDLMDQLCRTVLYPLASRIVRAKLDHHHHDTEDLVQDVVLRLATELQRMRSNGTRTIQSVIGWTVASAVNGCRDVFRQQHWPRTQLANAMRYVVGHSMVFRVWASENRHKVCGWRRCMGTAPLSPGQLNALLAEPAVRERMDRVNAQKIATVRRALARIFVKANGSVYYNLLVAGFVEASGSPRTIWVDLAVFPDPAGDASADEPLIERGLLQFLWHAAMELPEEQRLALLMHLSGKVGITAFWERGAVMRPAVATALRISEQRLDELPWSDLQIADHIEQCLASSFGLGASQARDQLSTPDSKRRQQRIINWRRDARRGVQECLTRSYQLVRVP